MIHNYAGKNHLLNLIDTPGHVDFAWEVSRSLAACQGALLLVDASQGVQAQSLSVFHAAKDRGLTIIPVLNKVDQPCIPVAHSLMTLRTDRLTRRPAGNRGCSNAVYVWY